MSVLFTGVTFSRYTTTTSGDISAGVSPFVVSYEIDNVSSNTYTNANFWLDSGTRQGTPRTIRFTLRNFERNAEGTPVRVSDVELKATLRLYLPAEFADNLVLQVTDGTRAVTPQYVIGNMLYKLNAPQAGTEYYTYDTSSGARSYAAHGSAGVSLETQYFRDYNAVAGSADDTLTLYGGIEENGAGELSGTVAASGAAGSVCITASNALTSYSVGFRRQHGTDNSIIHPQLFLDLEKSVPFYTIDISLSGDAMRFDAHQTASKQYVLYLTLAENITSSDFNHYWDESFDPHASGSTQTLDHFLTPTAGTTHEFYGGTVTGYHFDAYAHTYGADFSARGATTQIRVQKTYARDGAGNYTGESTLSFSHVAPISETTVNYVHAISEFYAQGGGQPLTELPADMQGYQSLYGVCTNLAGNATGAEYYMIGLNGITDDPFQESFGAQSSLAVTVSLSKTYSAQVNVVFEQTGGAA